MATVLSVCMLAGFMMNAQQPRLGSASVKTGDPSCGLVYGKDHMLLVCAPEGWVLDNKMLADQGIYAAFYRRNLTSEKAQSQSTLMYVDVQSKSAGRWNAEQMMTLDAEKTRRDSPKLVVRKTAPILIPADKAKNRKARAVPVQTFLNDYGGGYEATAYVEDEHTITLLVISSVSEALLQRDYPSFVKLVKSYSFVGSDGHMQ